MQRHSAGAGLGREKMARSFAPPLSGTWGAPPKNLAAREPPTFPPQTSCKMSGKGKGACSAACECPCSVAVPWRPVNCGPAPPRLAPSPLAPHTPPLQPTPPPPARPFSPPPSPLPPPAQVAAARRRPLARRPRPAAPRRACSSPWAAWRASCARPRWPAAWARARPCTWPRCWSTSLPRCCRARQQEEPHRAPPHSAGRAQ